MRSELFVAAVLSVASGCASAGFHQVSFAGETSTAGSAPPTGKTVHVVRNVSMKDTILEARIRYKRQEFLLERGYTLAAADTADLYVLAPVPDTPAPSAVPVSDASEVECRPRVPSDPVNAIGRGENQPGLAWKIHQGKCDGPSGASRADQNHHRVCRAAASDAFFKASAPSTPPPLRSPREPAPG